VAWKDCLDEIRKGAENLSDDQLLNMLEAMQRRARRESGTGQVDAEGLRIAAAKMVDEEKKKAALAKRTTLINMRARIALRQRIADEPSGVIAGFHKEIRGLETDTTGSRVSAQAQWKANQRRWVGGMVRELGKAGLFDAARSGALEREWTKELFELSKGKDGNPGVTGSAEALTIARIVGKYQDLARAAVNRAGGAIGDYAGYITRTSHDMDKIRRAGPARWSADIRPELRPDTFDYVGGPAGKGADDFLANVQAGLASGVHLTHEGMQGFKDAAFTGPGNLARRVSQEKVLHFNDAEGWLRYHAKYGRGSVLDNVIQNLERSARAAALMNHFTTNPRAELQASMRWFAENRRASDPALAERLDQMAKSQRGSIWNEFDFLDGTANTPEHRLAARIGAGVRNAVSMGRLGLVLLTHLSVGSTKAAEMRYQGINLFERYANAITSLKPGRNNVADDLLAGLEGMQRDIVSRFTLDDGLPGTGAALANLFFKLNGLSWTLGHERQGGEEMMARMFGRQFDRGHAELEPETQRLLRISGISEREWELLRAAPDHTAIDDREFLTPQAAMHIPDDQVIAHLFEQKQIDNRAIPPGPAVQRKLDAWRDDLAMRLYAMFNDRSEHMIIAPDIQTRATLLRGTRPGSAEGEFLRFVAQFKQWPVALVQHGIGREVYGGGSGWSYGARPSIARPAGILQMALPSSVLGMGILAAKDLLKGKNPRDWLSPKTWAAAMMQGGGIGILGDFLFGEYSRFGQGITDTLAGPVLGEGLSTVFDMWNRLKGAVEEPDKKHDIAPELFRALLDNAPFVNILGLRTALNYLFLWQVQEALNPGSVRRMERRVEQQNHQTYWLSPSQAVAR
jgi:hypothetical protein